MSISGNLEDVSGVDVMQFIHLGQRTGTLVLERADQRALIGFHDGKLISAKAPGQPRVGELLVERGLIDRLTLAEAMAEQQAGDEHRTLGQILVGRGDIPAQALKEVVFEQIRQTISEVIQWQSGHFEFVVDDLRPVDDIALFPGEVVPSADLNTQMILLEAMRIFDERNRDRGRDGEPPLVPPWTRALTGGRGVAAGAAAPARPAAPEPDRDEGRSAQDDPGEDTAVLDFLEPTRSTSGMTEILAATADGELLAALRQAGPRLTLPVRTVDETELGRADAARPGALVLFDLRDPGRGVAELERLCRRRVHGPVIALVAEGEPAAAAYAAGAVAVLPPDAEAVAACVGNLLGSRAPATYPRGRRPASGEQETVLRLRRVFGDLRSGLITATVALNLMHVISESVERAVLFLVRRDDLAALGAFGEGADGSPLALLTRNLRLSLEDDSALTRSLREEQAGSFPFDETSLPAELARLLGRPRNGQMVIFPVLGARRVIAMIYTDNGEHDEVIEDIEILELATAQVGMAFENELLRHQISKQAPEA